MRAALRLSDDEEAAASHSLVQTAAHEKQAFVQLGFTAATANDAVHAALPTWAWTSAPRRFIKEALRNCT